MRASTVKLDEIVTTLENGENVDKNNSNAVIFEGTTGNMGQLLEVDEANDGVTAKEKNGKKKVVVDERDDEIVSALISEIEIILSEGN
ncbi:hypothetical protein PVK06_024036 [Gossypium arboreum]|uniref:Uncharacterized protein n=1 Tax=Gossypium arboreum TaxID=29729 RepID=A0ABR0PCU9_GOSAR|nr:hypothetical protein PVK06_024036 [Gossypium arboreum]